MATREGPPQAGGNRPAAFATRPVVAMAAAVGAALLALAGRYGYHRDELYFLTAGRHLDWGYPDQPPLVPLIARTMSALAPDSLVALRLPSALAAAAVVAVTALIARELGAGRGGQLLAAACMAAAALLLVVGHMLSTMTYALLAWTVLLWLAVRLLRTRDQRLWLAAGAVAGVGLLAHTLVAFLLAAVVAGILVAGPRRVLASPWPWAGGLLAAALWSPYLVWQARHGWPQLEVSAAIAAGGSGTSEPRGLFLPLQFGLVSPLLAPVWIVGLVRLLRDEGLRWARAVGWAYPLLAVLFLVTGGKPYYLGGMYPVLLAAGAQPVVDWARRASWRRVAIGTAVAAGAAGSALLMLPVLPASALPGTPVLAVNYDAGETVGWPGYVRQIAAVHRAAPPGTVLLTGNYGEAGAIDRYGPALGLPRAYSGHNGYWHWGRPPDGTGTVVAVGLPEPRLRAMFTDVRPVARLDNGLGLDNEEQGIRVWICSGPRAPWADLWPRLRKLG